MSAWARGPVSTPKYRDHCRLARRGVLAGGLADLGLAALDVQHVVGDLERDPEIASVGRQKMPLLNGRPSENSARFSAVLDQSTGFQRLQAGHRRAIKRLAFRQHVDHLPARHAARTRGGPERHDQFAARLRIGMCVRLRQQFERPALQGITRQNRSGLIECLMRAGFATPEVVVVHRRKIVMNKGVGVHHLHRGGNPCRTGLADGEQRGGFHHQERPHAACRRPALRSASPRRAALRSLPPGAAIRPAPARQPARRAPSFARQIE